MKKTIIFVFVFWGLSNLFSQSRTNAELPNVSDTGKIINNILGWSKDMAGQWKSSKNEAPGWETNFTQMKLWDVSYKNKKIVLFGIYERDIGYEYPTIKVGPYYYISLNYFLLNSDDFVVIIKKDQKSDNVFNCFLNSYIDDRNESFTLERIQSTIARGFNIAEEINRGQYAYDKLSIFTYYYTEDNVVRFWISGPYFGGVVKTMPDNHYFECAFEEFTKFFNVVIQ